MKKMMFPQSVKQRMDLTVINAQMQLCKMQAEFKKLREEDEGLDVLITLVLLALGLVIVGILAKYAQAIIGKADKEVGKIVG